MIAGVGLYSSKINRIYSLRGVVTPLLTSVCAELALVWDTTLIRIENI